MSTSSKLTAGAYFPELSFQKVGGGELSVGGQRDRWTLLVVYRGLHCGRCKKYLGKLETQQSAWRDAGFEIVVVSADSQEKAQTDVKEQGWSFDVGYGLSETQMGLLGLYVSEPLSDKETDRRFAEPGVFCVRPDGVTQVISISNAPAGRTDLEELLDGMIFTIERGRPPRGTVQL